MNCDAVRGSLQAYLDETLPSAQGAAVESHLRACAACAQETLAFTSNLAASPALSAHDAAIANYRSRMPAGTPDALAPGYATRRAAQDTDARTNSTETGTPGALEERLAPWRQPWRWARARLKRANLGTLDLAALFAFAVLSAFVARTLIPDGAPKAGVEKSVSGNDELPQLSDADKEKFARLVKQLTDEDVEHRDAAQAALLAMGPGILPLLEPLLKSDDQEVRVRVQAVVKRLEANVLLAKLEALTPGITAQLSQEDPEKRQVSVLAWGKSVEKRDAAPLLVELVQRQEPGPLLWGCWEALSNFSAPQFFQNTNSGLILGRGTVFWNLQNIEGVRFSAAAKVLAEANQGTPLKESKTIPVRLGIHLKPIGAGFCASEDGSCEVLTGPEGALFWKTWWARARQNIDWQPGNPAEPTPANLAAWSRSLEQEHTAEAERASARFRDQLPNAVVHKALSELAGSAKLGHARARDLLDIHGLRNAGVILFGSSRPDGELTPWIMNADGTRQRPLFPALTKEYMDIEAATPTCLLVNHQQALKYWQPGLPEPVLIGPMTKMRRRGRHLAFTFNDRIAYLATLHPNKRYETQASLIGALKLYDLNRKEHIPLPEEVSGGVRAVQLLPDGKSALLIRVLNKIEPPEDERNDIRQDEDRELWRIDFTTMKLKQVLKFGKGNWGWPNFDLSASGRHLSFLQAQTTNGRPSFRLWIVDLQSDQTMEYPIQRLGNIDRHHWSDLGDLLYIAAGDYPTPPEFLEWKPGAEPRRLPKPNEFSFGPRSGFFQGCVGGRLLFDVDDCWLADPSGIKPSIMLPGHLKFSASAPVKNWRLVSQNSQVTLLSEDFLRLVPLTHSGESYSPFFLEANEVWKPAP